jgi:hypothetical protein
MRSAEEKVLNAIKLVLVETYSDDCINRKSDEILRKISTPDIVKALNEYLQEIQKSYSHA